ncbi:ABC transporter permease [Streptomyces sp. SP17BM10]|uniref:ABC transporter permease n=1 Tax=Streptomyces sp. SP17BM10 TaxID=3002530 RepID=UPI002E768535|nr:ABC transporter permease [Streptomyces sp. SP17BM10]MEE1785875.1 ABC transporter permease [Streptomyces sp. SP17BM10]
MTTVVAEPADPLAPAPAPRGSGRARLVLTRLLAARGALAGGVLVLLLFALAFGGPYLTPWDYAAPDFTALHQPPSAQHWFGTNGIGQDVFAQSVRGLQKSLIIGLLVALFSTVLASLVGACAGYFGGWADRCLMFVVDLLLVFPSFLIITIVSPRLKSTGWIAFVLLLALFNWMITARVVRSMTLSLREREFVRAARFMGVRPLRIILRHVLPNVASFLIIDATIAVGGAVMSETALSYFGFGVKPPDVSLGTLLAAGTSEAPVFPWLFYFPAALLVLFVLAVNLVGDGLRDALDPTAAGTPRRRARRKKP